MKKISAATVALLLAAFSFTAISAWAQSPEEMYSEFITPETREILEKADRLEEEAMAAEAAAKTKKNAGAVHIHHYRPHPALPYRQGHHQAKELEGESGRHRQGILVWQDFWLANPYDGPNPYDPDKFNAVARRKQGSGSQGSRSSEPPET